MDIKKEVGHIIKDNIDVIVVGGGAAGMLAAVFAARRGKKTVILEKNDRLGKKLFITGKGRCNLTNGCDTEELFQNVITNAKFLYGPFYTFTNQDTIDFFEGLGLRTKIERGNRVFPQSDKSFDVIGALLEELNRLSVEICYFSEVTEILTKEQKVYGVKLKGDKILKGEKVIIATGGLSYPLTGSTGDGYRFAKDMGHKVTKLTPSLVPMNLLEKETAKELQGLSLKNVQITVKADKKKVYEDFGEMLFTHYGVSGPLILSASSHLIPHMKSKEITLSIDLKPALSEEQLDTRILRDFDEFSNKQYKNALDNLLPRKLIPVIIAKSGIDPEKKVNLITREERGHLLHLLKNFTFHISSLRDYNEAVITKGGIHVKEINPATMESKLVQGVYFIGEVLDLDALTGGFNLQIAWSTAYVAGNEI